MAFTILCSRDYKIRREADILELEQRGQKRIRFGNDMEKLEKEVIWNCRLLRVRADRKALRRKVRSVISILAEIPRQSRILERILNLIRCWDNLKTISNRDKA